MRRIIASTDRSETSIRLKNRSQGIKALTALSLSLAVYGMVGWIYVAICGLVAPDTLHLPLTHLLPHLREDTSGVISFIVSFIGFLVYRIVRDNLCDLRPRSLQCCRAVGTGVRLLQRSCEEPGLTVTPWKPCRAAAMPDG
jgi:hypothetical protein